MTSITDPFLLPGTAGSQIFQAGENRELERDVLPGYTTRCRWFGGKAREPHGFRIREAAT